MLNSSKTSEEVIGEIKESFNEEFSTLKSVTFDRGADLPITINYLLALISAIQAWQKVAVENKEFAYLSMLDHIS